MLGEQFNLTYWHDDVSGEPRFVAPRDEYGRVYDPKGVVSTWTKPTKAKGDWDKGTPAYELPHQGMLFSPWVGTGVGRDPALGPDHDAAIRSALKLDDTAKYMKSFGRTDTQAASDAEMLVNAVKRTSIPRSVIDTRQVRAGIVNATGRSNADNSTINILHQDGVPDVGSLAHEMGHTFDGALGDEYSQRRSWLKVSKRGEDDFDVQGPRPDPREEGIADGFADRFTRLASARATPESMGEMHKSTGYSTEFSGFKDKAGKALYAAVRAHASSQDIPSEGVESRDTLVGLSGITGSHDDSEFRRVQTNQRSGKTATVRSDYVTGTVLNRGELMAASTPNKLLLGHMAHTYPHIVPTLEAQGFGKDVQKSLDLYRSSVPPVPHDVELKTGEDANLSRQQFRKEQHGRALSNWESARSRPNTQTETLF